MTGKKKFQRVIEDFVCGHCGTAVQGNGYTNHCPRCLWSKHVDVYPGDRAAVCGGLMEPIAIEGSTPAYRVVHRCRKCSFVHRNSIQEEDDQEAVIVLATRT